MSADDTKRAEVRQMANELDALFWMMVVLVDRMRDRAKYAPELGRHANELLGASAHVSDWANGLRKEIDGV